MAHLTIIHGGSSGERTAVSVPISEKITWWEQFLRTAARKLPKWAGRMSYSQGDVHIDAKLLGWAIGLLTLILVGLGAFNLREIYSMNGKLERQEQIQLNDRQNYINYGLQTNEAIQRLDKRLERMESRIERIERGAR